MLIPEIPNQVFLDRDSAIRAPLRKFNLVHDKTFDYYFNESFSGVEYDNLSYQNDQSSSPVFVEHLQNVLSIVASKVKPSSKVVELGCGKGAFFSFLSHLNFKSLSGFDKTYQGDDPRIYTRYLDSRDKPLNADVLIMRHVLEHIPNPISFLRDLVTINGRDCDLIIEIPSTDWIIRNGSYWDFTYEHVNYFTLNSLKNFFPDSQIFELFDNQYYLLIANLKSFAFRENSEYLPSTLLSDLIEKSLKDTNIFRASKRVEPRFWLWGGATKGVMTAFYLSNNMSPDMHLPVGIVDINPKKQGKFVAFSGLRIFSPFEFVAKVVPNDQVFVTNPVYLTEVKDFLDRELEFDVDVFAIS